MERMDHTTEKRILEAMEAAIESANRGVDPSEAIHKVAAAQKFGAPVVRRMVEAFNVSKTLAHMKHAGANEKANSFPLAHADKILEKMYPTKMAQIVPIDYEALPGREKVFTKAAKLSNSLPAWQKLAPYPRDTSYAVGRWFAKRDHLKQASDAERLAVTDAYDKMASAISRAADYFRHPGHESFEGVEKRALWEYDSVGKSMMDLIYTEACLNEKRALPAGPAAAAPKPAAPAPAAPKPAGPQPAGPQPVAPQAAAPKIPTMPQIKPGVIPNAPAAPKSASARPLVFDRSREPYASIAAAIVHARRLEEKTASFAAIEKERSKHGESYPRAMPVHAVSVLDDLVASPAEVPQVPFALKTSGLAINKEALDFTTLLAGKTVADLMGGLTGAADGESAKSKALEKIYDPQHEAVMSTARVKAMMNDFLANDDILSTYPQEKVMDAYNQLARMAPVASQQPAVMRGMLRKMIQQGGVVEPFEVSQLENIESGLRKLSPGALPSVGKAD